MDHPFLIEFASWGEAIVHLRSHLLRGGAPITPDEMGELLLERVGRGSARRWTGWLRGSCASRDQLDAAQRAEGLATLARLFVEHWPELIARPPGARLDGDHVQRIADALAALPVHAPDRAPEPISGASLQSLVRAYLDDHGLRHSDLAERVSAGLRAHPLLAAVADCGEDPIRQWHVQRIASGKGLDPDSPPYYLFVRAFAALRGEEPRPYFQLPFRSAASQLGVFLRVRLAGPGEDLAEVDGAVCAAFERLAGDVLAQTVLARMDATPGRYAGFEPIERRPEKGGGLELSLRLKPTLGLPPSTTYGPALLLFVEFARQLRLSWSAHALNVSRLKTGASPLSAIFVLHAGVRPALDRVAREEPSHGSRIVFTSDAYYHARAADLRISWLERPRRAPAPGTKPTPVAPGDGSGVHAVYAFHSHLYYGEVESFRDDPAGPGRGTTLREIARANPMDVFYGNELAVSLFQRRQFHDALRVARQVLAVDARHPTAWAVVALIYGNLAREDAPAGEASSLSAFDATARYYHRGLAAARMAIEADRSQEDAHVLCGCLHLLRALDGLRWFDRPLVEALGTSRSPVRLILAGSGFAWAAQGSDDDVESLLRRAALEDLVEARAEFDRGVEASPTKSRSLFWRFIADAFLDLSLRQGEVGPGPALPAALTEIGWMPAGADEATILRILESKIDDYDSCLLLESYRPEVHLAYAVIYWDFLGQTLATARRTREHLERALLLSSALGARAGGKERFVMRCWGYLQPRALFEQHVRIALGLVEAWEATGVYTPLHPVYLGEAISRAFARFLASLVPGAANGAAASAAPPARERAATGAPVAG